VHHAGSQRPRKGRATYSVRHAHTAHTVQHAHTTHTVQHAQRNTGDATVREGNRTVTATAIVPPFTATTPLDMNTTPPFCTPDSHPSAAPIRLRPDRPALQRVPLGLRRDRKSPQTRTSRCRRTCLAHHREISAHERGAQSLGEDSSIPHVQRNMRRSLRNKADATEATCNVQRQRHARRMLHAARKAA
jgi:hypothetical protein